MNDTELITPYTQNNFSSMKSCLWNWQWIFILVNKLHFTLNTVIKDLLFLLSNDIHEKRVVSAIFLILLTKNMRNPNASLAHFSNLFQVEADYVLTCSEVKW